MKPFTMLFAICLAGLLGAAAPLSAQEVLPFPEPPSASVAGKMLKDSKHQWRKAESHLPKNAPAALKHGVNRGGLSLKEPPNGTHGFAPLPVILNVGSRPRLCKNSILNFELKIFLPRIACNPRSMYDQGVRDPRNSENYKFLHTLGQKRTS